MDFLEVENVVKQFAGHRALDRVSLTVPENTVYGLLGPNGAGKTTLIRIINCITAPDSGEVRLNGKRMTPADVQHIGYLPEERGLYKKMKIGEQALYLAQLKGMTKSDAQKALRYWFEKFEIQDWWNKKVEELSKGMAQKVQFITTILHDPKLLIFDEPFSGFDPVIKVPPLFSLPTIWKQSRTCARTFRWSTGPKLYCRETWPKSGLRMLPIPTWFVRKVRFWAMKISNCYRKRLRTGWWKVR